ncbi:ASPIC/UnbV domain-containing protein [bacterium]|nr:ASPIC/UnbV domain-containing protein [bacterium]
MRQDETVGRKLRGSGEWDRNPQTGLADQMMDARVETGDEVVDGKLRVHSLSGHERNKLYLNEASGSDFEDVSGVSGLDDEADGRAFAVLDYDRDGWNDIVLVNAMNPLTRLFRNELGDSGREGNMLAISLRGGNRSASSSEWSNRDGYGARVEIRKGQKVIEREHRCGQGYGSQNSAIMLVGLGDWEEVEEILVRWPSGKKTTVKSVPSAALIVIDEQEGEVSRQPYRRNVRMADPALLGKVGFPLRHQSAARLKVWKGMATWCPACARYRSHFEHLKKMTEGRGVDFLGFPLDESEDNETLSNYRSAERLPYYLKTGLSTPQRKQTVQFLKRWIGAAELPLPTTVITNNSGHVVWVGAGAPSVSEIRRLLDGE